MRTIQRTFSIIRYTPVIRQKNSYHFPFIILFMLSCTSLSLGARWVTKILQVLDDMNPETSRMMREVSIPASLNKRGSASIVPPIIELRRANIVLIELLTGLGLSIQLSAVLSNCYQWRGSRSDIGIVCCMLFIIIWYLQILNYRENMKLGV